MQRGGIVVAMAMALTVTGVFRAGADPVHAEEPVPWEPGGAVAVTYWDRLTFDAGVALDGVGTPGAVVTAVDERGRLGWHPVRVSDDGTWSTPFYILPGDGGPRPGQEDIAHLTITQRTDGAVDSVVELDVGEEPASGFAVTTYERPASGPHFAGVGMPGDTVYVRACDEELTDCGAPRWFTVADDGTWYVVVPEPEATFALFDVFRDGTRIDGRSTYIFAEPWEWHDEATGPVLDGTRVDLYAGAPSSPLAPLPGHPSPVDSIGWVDDPIFGAPRPGGEVAVRNAGLSLDGSRDLLFGVGTPGARVRVAAGDSDPDRVEVTVAADGTWSAERRRGAQTGAVTVTQTVDEKMMGTVHVDAGAPLPEGFAVTQVEGRGYGDFLGGEGTPGDTVIVRQCSADYPTCRLAGEFTVPGDGTWWFELLNRADGPTLMDAYRDGTWLGGRAAWVTGNTLTYGVSRVELDGTLVELGPVAIPVPQVLELDGGSGAQPPADQADGDDASEANRDRDGTAGSGSSPEAHPWLLAIAGGLGLTGAAVVFVVRQRHRGKARRG